MKSIANQYRDLKEGKMSQQNFMRNLRMTMPQFVTNVTSFGDAVKILKNKSIIVEATLNEFGGDGDSPDNPKLQSAARYLVQNRDKFIKDYFNQQGASSLSSKSDKELYDYIVNNMHSDGVYDTVADMKAGSLKENFDFNKSAIESATGDKISHTEEDDFGETIYWSTENPYVNYYIGSDEQIIKYDGKTGERYPIGDLRNYDEPPNDDYEPDTDADYEEPRDDFDMAGDYNDGEFWEGKGEDDEELSAMVKKMEDEKAGEEAVKSQYGLNEAKKPNVEKAEDENLEEVTLGIFMEHACFPDKSYEEIEKIVKKNVKKNPNYYTNYKLTGIRDYELQTMDSSKPEDHQMKFYTEKTAVDTARGMQKVKMPKKEEKKKLKEARFNVIGEPNEVAKQAMQFVDGNNTLKALSDDIVIQQTSDPNEALLRFGYWDALPSEAVEKLKLQFNVEKDSDSDEDTGEIIFYRLTPLRNFGSKDLGASFEKMKKELEEIVRETINEYFDGRDNLINPLSAEDENN